ncbi:MAG: methyltransferase domain-containing protein [Algicola sp.]|nr:methyltransferase domain-containing protein [Algicola sp.]
MISLITQAWRETSFDFRKYAHPDDPLTHLFDEWVDYYRLKWAIAKVIQPDSILEVGVRYGYSAMAFLKGAPNARYVGIDIDSVDYGGEVGALNWARKQMADYDGEVIIGNTQDMLSFPGGQSSNEKYDLIHIDGQQDGDSTYRDLEKALKQGKYILVDGYFWSSENYAGSNAFLHDHKELIEYYFVIPGYAGELLIKVDQTKAALLSDDGSDLDLEADIDSLQIKEHYGEAYYLNDCGGFEQYKARITHKTSNTSNTNSTQQLLDPRLDAVFNIANVSEGMHVVDAGCGRGELSFASVKLGATVDAVDYSQSAINLARQCFAGSFMGEADEENIDFHCSSITDFDFTRKADRVIASDLVEHLAPNELDMLYANISQGLTDSGQLVVHTFPNLWLYQYGYEARRKAVAKAGGYLSPQPRSYFERLMHINEQSPRVLRDQLSHHFSHVKLWFGTYENPFDSLHRSYGKSDCINATCLFAIASNAPIDLGPVKTSNVQARLSEAQMNEVRLELIDVNLAQQVKGKIEVTVRVNNNNTEAIKSRKPYPVCLAYHWCDAQGKAIVFEGVRTDLPKVGPKLSQRITMTIDLPEQAGPLTLQIGLVQEGAAWFESFNARHLLNLDLKIVDREAAQ